MINRSHWPLIGVTIVLCVYGFFALRKDVGPTDADIIHDLNRLAEQQNAAFPRIVDGSTRVESMSVGPGKRIAYKYTLLDTLRTGLDPEVFRETMRDIWLKRAEADVDFAPFRQDQVTIVFDYYDKEDEKVVSITLLPGEY